MAHDSSDGPGRFAAGPAAGTAHPHPAWDPAIGPLELAAGGSHPLFVTEVGQPLDWDPRESHHLASPLSDGVDSGSLR